MKVNLEDFRRITILVDTDKNIVIFPIGVTNIPMEKADGTISTENYREAYYPIELKYPYIREELAKKIEYGIGEWCKHPCYIREEHGNVTFEAKYHGMKSFKKAVKGFMYFSLGWNSIEGKYVDLAIPWKGAYAYMGIETTYLPEDADWLDFADAVLEFINMDVTQLHRFKTYKRELNW